MSKVRSPLILDTIGTSKARQISDAIESVDLSRESIVEMVEKLQVAQLTGLITLSRQWALI